MTEITDKHFRECLNHVSGTPEGQVVLFFLMEHCTWNTVVANSDSPEKTQFYTARRSVYGWLRQMIRPEYLKVIEFDLKRKIDGTRQTDI